MLLSDSGGTVMIIQLLNTLLFKFYEYFLYMTYQQEVALERWLEYESETSLSPSHSYPYPSSLSHVARRR